MPTLVVDQVLTGASLGLSSGLSDLLVVDVGGRRVLYALSRTDGQLVEIGFSGLGSLSVVTSLATTGTFAAGSTPGLALVENVAGSASLAIAGLPETDGQVVTLGATGALGSQSMLAGASVLVSPAGVDLGTAKAVISGRLNSGGLDLLTNSGSGYTFTAALEDAPDRYLGDVAGTVTFAMSESTFLASVSATENGLNLVQITPNGLQQLDAFGAAEGVPINAPSEIGVIQRLGETLLVTGSFGNSSLSVVTVGPSGQLQLSDHVLDSSATRFQGVSALDTLVFGDFAFMAAGGADGGVSLFTVLPGGRLVHLDSLADNVSTSLYRVSAIELTTTGARLNAVVSSSWETEITRLGYDLSGLGSVLFAPMTGGLVTGTALDDQILGSDMADTLTGGSGRDIISDGAGQDLLTGGAGADVFIMHPDGQADEITDYERAADRLDLSAFDFLYDVSQLSVTPTLDGALITYGPETLIIRSADALPLTPSDFSNDSILNLDRPPLVPISQALVGDAGNDVLNGAAGPDTLRGAGGDDTLAGYGGDDDIAGGIGADQLDGGSGDDTVAGEAGGDTIAGGLGNDVLTGGSGDDVIYGDEWPGP